LHHRFIKEKLNFIIYIFFFKYCITSANQAQIAAVYSCINHILFAKISGNIFSFINNTVTKNKNQTLADIHIIMFIHFLYLNFILFARSRFPIRINGAKYNKNIVNGPKINHLAITATLGSNIIGSIFVLFRFIQANIIAQFTSDHTSNCGHHITKGTKKAKLKYIKNSVLLFIFKIKLFVL